MNTEAPGRNPVEVLADEFLERYRRGERPSVKEYQEHYPDLAAQIEELFPALIWMEQAASGSVNDAPASLRTSPHLPTLEQLGDFRIVREIGRGGMGVVYEAEQESLGRRVALKVLPRHLMADERLAHRFEREARAAARLHHSNIVPVFGGGYQDGLYYYVMQFIQGQGLDQVLMELRRIRVRNSASTAAETPYPSTPSEKAPPSGTQESICQVAQALLTNRFMPPGSLVGRAAVMSDDLSPAVAPAPGEDPQALEPLVSPAAFVFPGRSDPPTQTSARRAYWRSVARIGIQAAQALQYAHDQGIIHRDVKPANLLLDLHGTVWVTDFGLAKATHQGDLTQTGDVLGTLRYMAPEQFEGRSDARADVYSLGLTLYELLALTPAFGERDRSRLIRQVTSLAPARLRAHNPHIPRDLETIVHKAIDREPEHRYRSAQALADDLQRFERGEPIRARPLAAWEICWKWCRRNPTLASLSATVLLLLLIATAGSLLAARVYQSQRNSLEQALGRLEQSAGQLRIERDRALTAELAERSKRAEALFDKTRMGRFSGQIGRRSNGLAAIDEAVRIKRSLTSQWDPLDPHVVDLRSEAIACLGLRDVRVVSSYAVESSMLNHLHAGTGLRAHSSDRRTIQFHLHGRALGEVELGVAGATVTQLAISPDGKLAAASFAGPSSGVGVWNGMTRELICRHPLPNAPGWLGFSHNSRILGAVHEGGDVSLIPADAAGGPKTTATRTTLIHAAFSPDDGELAVSADPGLILILGVESGRINRRLPLGFRPMSVDWNAHGTRLAVGGFHGGAQVIDARSAALIADLGGHKSAVTSVYYHPEGDHLATSSWDGTTRIWNIPLRQEILRASGWMVGPGFDPAGLRLSFVTSSHLGVWEVLMAPECRILAGHAAGTTVTGSTFHRQSQLLATWGYDGVRLWNAATGTELGLLEVGKSEGAAFDRHGNLFTSSALGLLQWPISAIDESRKALRVGPPVPVGVGSSSAYLTLSSAADRLAYIVNQDGRAAVRDLASRRTIPLVRQGDLSVIAISSSGKWVAGAPQHTQGVTLWNAETGDVIRQLPTAGWAACTFSPDEQWFVVSDVREIRFWRTNDWTLGRVVPSPGIGCVAFSPDSRLLATAKYLATGAANAVQLIDVASGRMVARLENTPAPTQIERYLTFSPDGRYLAVPHYADGILSLWDLAAIRGRLGKMGLDWGEEGRSPPTIASRPLPVHVDQTSFEAIRHLRGANQLLTAKNFAEAIAEADAGLRIAPEYPELWYIRGRGHAGLKEYEQAVTDYSQAIALEPRQVEAYHYRGHSHDSLKHFADAVADFETACHLQPRDSHLLDHLGRCQRHAGNFAAAVEAWRESLRLQPLPKTRHDLAQLLLVGPVNLRNAAEAMSLVEEAMKNDPDQASWLATLGMACYRLDRFEDAAAKLDQAAATTQEGGATPTLRFFQAMAWNRRGDAGKARERYERATAEAAELTHLSPGDRALLELLASEARATLEIK